MSTPGGWTAPQYALPLGGSGDSGPAGIGQFATWTQTEWNQWLNARFAEWLEQYGIPFEYLDSVASSLVLAFQGETGPLEDLIEDAVREIPVIGDMLADLKDAFEGTYDGDDLALSAIQSVVSALRSLASGKIDASRITSLFIGNITNTNAPNLLDNGGFAGAVSMQDDDGVWSWDETEGHESAGSAKVTAGGVVERVLTSNLVPVTAGDVLDVGAWVKWSGCAGSGSGFEVQVRAFSGASVLSTTAVAQRNISASSSWVQLTDDYTVPAGADGVRVRIVVTAAVAAGTVWWDDVSLKQTATTLPQQWIAGLTDALGDLGDWIEAVVNQLLGALGVPALGTLFDKIADLSDEIEGWFGDTQDRAAELADLIGDLLSNPGAVLGDLAMGKITGLAGSLASKAENTVVAAVQQFILDLANAILSAIRKVPVVGGTIADRIEDVVDDLGGLKDQADGTKAGIVAGWTGGSSSGADVDVYDTVADIRAAILSGYTVEAFTSSGIWTKPAGITELVVIAIAAGANGGSGSAGGLAASGSSNATGGVGGFGGVSGGYIAKAIDPADVSSTVTCTVGASNGAATSFGSYVTSAPGAGGIATAFGYSATSSTPGGGGGGGHGDGNGSYDGTGTPGNPGAASAAAVGGAGGTYTGSTGTANSGGDGVGISASAATKCGGGGGGGGSGAGGGAGVGTTYRGGPGGAGGYPGGGGGGGGGGGSYGLGGSSRGGAGGAGAAGCLWIFYR